jgi:hypothetical protein
VIPFLLFLGQNENYNEIIEQQSKFPPPYGLKLKQVGGQSKIEILINQRSNWSPRLYCKYAVTNNPAKVIGIRPKTIPNSKTSIISFVWKGKGRGNIYS